MFSVTAACAADEDEETAEAARRYFVETNRTDRKRQRPEPRFTCNKRGNGRKQHTHTRLKHRPGALGKVSRSSSARCLSPDVLAYLHQAPLAAALLGNQKKRVTEGGTTEDEEEEDGDGRRDSTGWGSFLFMTQPVCCPNTGRSRSHDDQTMFTFWGAPRSTQCIFDKDYLDLPGSQCRRESTMSDRALIETRNGRKLSGTTAGVASSDGDLSGCLVAVPNRTTLVDLDTPVDNTDKQNTLTTNTSYGALNGPDCLSSQTSDVISINVGGLRFQTYLGTLERFPDTLLGNPLKRSVYFNPKLGEYFFDRHRGSFEAIMYYYQSNGRKLCKPENVPPDIFLRELQYFELGRDVIDRFLESQGCVRPKEVVLPKNNLQRRIWLLMEHPDSSLLARILAFVSVFVILVSTVSFCLETIPDLKYHPRNTSTTVNGTGKQGSGGGDGAESLENPFFIVELSCMCWFTLEFILRFGSCPTKLEFSKSFLNIIDFVAIVPFFVNLAWASTSGAGGSTPPFGVLRIFRLVRVFRIFKLSRHSRGLQILGKTFTASVQELCLLIFFLVIGLVLFSSAVYIAESGYDSGFESIPAAFWYTIVTMTTVGYGDLTPVGPWGKLVGGMCAITGVLVLALPVPVIVANFKHYYRQEARLSKMRAVQAEGDGDEELCEEDDSGSS